MAEMLDLPSDPLILKEKLRDASWGAAMLKRIPIFAKMDSGDLEALWQFGEVKTLQPKVSAVIEGEPTRGMYVLLLGTVSVFKNDVTTGTMRRLTFLEAGAFFGEFSLFDRAPRSATVSAENTCYLYSLDAESFDKFLKVRGDATALRFFRTCAEELVDRFRRLNGDYIISQQLLWKHALRREDKTKP